jgi:hypothetical protein
MQASEAAPDAGEAVGAHAAAAGAPAVLGGCRAPTVRGVVPSSPRRASACLPRHLRVGLHLSQPRTAEKFLCADR